MNQTLSFVVKKLVFRCKSSSYLSSLYLMACNCFPLMLVFKKTLISMNLYFSIAFSFLF